MSVIFYKLVISKKSLFTGFVQEQSDEFKFGSLWHVSIDFVEGEKTKFTNGKSSVEYNRTLV